MKIQCPIFVENLLHIAIVMYLQVMYTYILIYFWLMGERSTYQWLRDTDTKKLKKKKKDRSAPKQDWNLWTSTITSSDYDQSEGCRDATLRALRLLWVFLSHYCTYK